MFYHVSFWPKEQYVKQLNNRVTLKEESVPEVVSYYHMCIYLLKWIYAVMR